MDDVLKIIKNYKMDELDEYIVAELIKKHKGRDVSKIYVNSIERDINGMLTKYYKTNRFVRSEVIKSALAKHYKSVEAKTPKKVAPKAKSKAKKK